MAKKKKTKADDEVDFTVPLSPQLVLAFKKAVLKQGVTAQEAIGVVMEGVVDGRLSITKKVNYDEKDKDKRRAAVGKALMRENVILRTIKSLAKRAQGEEPN